MRLISITILCLLAIVRQSFAYTVNSTGDAALFVERGVTRPGCSTGLDSNGHPNGICTLRAAIQLAEYYGGSDTINFAIPASDSGCSASGVCTITVNSALPDISASLTSLTITGPGAGNLIIQRNSSSSSSTYRIFNITAGSPTAVNISGITVSNGNLTSGVGGGLQNASSASLGLTNCTFTNNYAPSGGALYNASSGAITISGCTFSSNSASSGGALYNASSGAITISGCTFTSNYGGGGDGGAITNAATGSLTVSNSTFGSNSSGTAGGAISNRSTGVLTLSGSNLNQNRAQAEGGAIANTGGGALSVSGCTLSSNSVPPMNGVATGGGGIFHASGTLTVSDSQITGNFCTVIMGGAAAPLFGGGVYAGGTATITNSTISNNSVDPGASSAMPAMPAYGQGGGIYSSGSLAVSNSTISGNVVTGGSITAFTSGTAGNGLGGGIFAAALNLVNTTVWGNSARGGSAAVVQGSYEAGGNGDGGGIYLSSGTSNISNSTIGNNSVKGGSGNSTGAGNGGGLYRAGGTVNVKSTIVAANSATSAGPDVFGAFTSAGYNFIGKSDNSSTGFTNATDITGTINSPLDAKFDSQGLQNNGGSVQTVALMAGSPAIDKGTSSGLTGNLTTDQRGAGFARTVDDVTIANAAGGDGTDIGAFELQTINPTPTPTATPSPTPGSSTTPSPTPTATATPTPTPTPTPVASLLNISTRMEVLSGDNVLIGGFIVTGTDTKQVLLRGLGSSLPVSNPLADPVLELHSSTSTIYTDDNWQDTQASQIQATGIPPSNPLESAIVATLPGNSSGYTAILRGHGDGTGIGLVEIYDLAQSASSKLANISTRGFVDTGDNVMIGGFIVGNGQVRVLVRAIGPSLPVSNALADPYLELHDGNGTVATNDNWVDSPDRDAIVATTIPPSNNLESAIIATLAPGNYTAVMRGADGGTGVGLVEVYNLQ